MYYSPESLYVVFKRHYDMFTDGDIDVSYSLNYQCNKINYKTLLHALLFLKLKANSVLYSVRIPTKRFWVGISPVC